MPSSPIATRAVACSSLYDAGERTVQQIADLFSVPRTTVYGHLDAASMGKRPAVQRPPNSPDGVSTI